MTWWTRLQAVFNPTRLTESMFGGYSDPDVNLTAEQGGSPYYRRLSKSERDFDSLTQERALKIAFYLYEMNPIAKAVLEKTRDFVLGEGVLVDVAGEDKALQQVVDGFWFDPMNQMDIKLHNKILELGLYGEACWTVFVNPVNGYVRLGYIDPADIKEIITAPQNVEDVQGIVLKSGPTSALATQILKVVRVNEEPGDRWHGRMQGIKTDTAGKVLTLYQPRDSLTGAPVGEAIPYAGACFFFAINKVTNALRGRSDLLAISDWVDLLDQFLYGEAERANLLKTFIWDVTIEGQSQEDIDKYAEKWKAAPKPASQRFHNDRMKWEAITPDLKASDAAAAADLFLSYIATGVSLPKTWLNGLMDVNKATAGEINDPAYKHLALRQRYVKYLLGQVMTFVLDQAEIHGKLKNRGNGETAPLERWPINYVFPEMRQRDLGAAATALKLAAEALATAKADDAIDTQVEQEVLASLFPLFGVEIDLEEMRDRLVKEKAERDAKAAVAPYPVGGSNGTGDESLVPASETA